VLKNKKENMFKRKREKIMRFNKQEEERKAI
jgi:hypothetical protein